MADLNSTIVRGKLRVTEDETVSGSISATTISEGGTLLSNKYQAKLPTTTTAGLFLKSTSTAGSVEWGTPTDKYHTPKFSSGVDIGTGTGLNDLYVPDASSSQKGVTQYTAANLSTWINQLTEGTSTPVDADYYVSQYVSGGTTTTTYHRRPMSALWTYIKGKADAVYAPKSHASSNSTYGLGTSADYGHMKFGAAEQNGATSTNGVVPPMGHVHGQYVTKPVSKTYTGLIATANNFANSTFYFINVKPASWTKEWTIKYKIEAGLDSGLTPSNYQYMGSNHECTISGVRGVMSTYSFFNSINHTSYRVQYYNALHEATETGFNNNAPHKIGIELTDAYERTNTSYKRTYKITILEAINCTATLLDAPEIPSQSSRTDYTKISATYYPNGADSNSPGYCWRGDLYSQGLRESGDDNSVDRLYYHTQYMDFSSTMGLSGYSLYGFDTAGKVQPISLYQSGYTSYTASINTARVYNTGGFDWTRGLLRWVSSGFIAAGSTNQVIHSDKVNTVDLRYTDNCVNSSTASNLTLVRNKYVYLRGTIGSDGLFYLAPLSVTYDGNTYKRAWTQDLPAGGDSYVYWLVGHTYDTYSYNLRLFAENPLYCYTGGQWREYMVPASSSCCGVVTTGTQTFGGTKTFNTAIVQNFKLSDYSYGTTTAAYTFMNDGSLYIQCNDTVSSWIFSHLAADISQGANAGTITIQDDWNHTYQYGLPQASGTVALKEETSPKIEILDFTTIA